MYNNNFQGENILVKISLVDKTGAAIPFASLTEITVVVADSASKSVTFTKTGGQITVGDTASQYKFELTEAITTAFAPGKLKARFTYKVPNAAYASGYQIDTVQEGIISDFLTLQV